MRRPCKVKRSRPKQRFPKSNDVIMSDERINLIFDFDGTLVNSYGAIIDAFLRLFGRYGVTCDPEQVRDLALRESTRHTLEVIGGANGLDVNAIVKEFSAREENLSLMSLYPHIGELLGDKRFRCFVYTHRGQSSVEILRYFGIDGFFEEIVNNTYGLARKPDGAGVEYLVAKYGLDRSKTYYVGDRRLDIECGLNAGCGAIFYQSSGLDIECADASFVVSDFGEIPGLFFPSAQ